MTLLNNKCWNRTSVTKTLFLSLTTRRIYIFSSIVSLFGNDIAENFVPMLTFCDGKEPQILASLLDNESTFKKSIYEHIKNNNPWYLQFNNSAFLKVIELENLQNYFGI